MNSFKTAHEIFEHAVVKTGKGYNGLTIYVKCPRCGKVGRLIRARPTLLGVRYRVIHDPRTKQGCNIGPTSEEHSYVEEIYNKYRKKESKASEDQRMQELGVLLLREVAKCHKG